MKDFTICAAKTKALISCAVTAQLICGFVFASAYCLFSHAVAHISDVLNVRQQLQIRHHKWRPFIVLSVFLLTVNSSDWSCTSAFFSCSVYHCNHSGADCLVLSCVAGSPILSHRFFRYVAQVRLQALSWYWMDDKLS